MAAPWFDSIPSVIEEMEGVDTMNALEALNKIGSRQGGVDADEIPVIMA